MASDDEALPRTRWEFRREPEFWADWQHLEPIAPGTDLSKVEGFGWEEFLYCDVRFVVNGRDVLGDFPQDPWTITPLIYLVWDFELTVSELRKHHCVDLATNGSGAGPTLIFCNVPNGIQVWGEAANATDDDPYGLLETARQHPAEYKRWNVDDVLFGTVPLSELEEASRRFSREVRAYLLPAFPSLRDNAQLGEWFRRDD